MKHLLLLLLILPFSLLSADSWTVLIYMAADNNLAENGKQNIREMEAAHQPEDLNLIVQADFPNEDARRYRIVHDQSPTQINSPILDNLGRIDSGDPQTLKDFILWGKGRYQADHYMLVIWSHGDSWYKNNKWISPDYDTGNMIGIANGELRGALTGSGPWDILLFDACSMQALEIITEINDLTDYVVASADLVPDTGFPYSNIIPILSQDPQEIASQIPGLYIDSYLPGGIHNPSQSYLTTTCSAISTADWDAFLQSWKSLSRSLRTHSAELLSIRQDLFEMNTGYADVDVKQLLIRLQNHGITEADPILNLWNEHVLASGFTLPYPETDIGTAALWFPDIRFNYDAAWQHYMKLDFAKTGWLGAVNACLDDAPAAPDPPSVISQNVLIDHLILRFAAPLSPDSLYYRLSLDDEEHLIFPPAYSPEFSFSTQVSNSGNYSIRAIDQNGLESFALTNSYTLSESEEDVLLIYPNPLQDAIAGKLIWKHQPGEKLSVSIFNIKGQRVLHKAYPEDVWAGELALMDLNGITELVRGIYLVSLKNGNRSLRCKLTIL